jgi:hypothetical protein
MTEWSGDMWAEASVDHDLMAREAVLALADAELEAIMPFLLASRSVPEFAHRSALAQESIRSIAARCGISEEDLMATARRHYELYREALTEGTDPVISLEPLLNGGQGGPEKPDEHDTGPDFSHGYSEVPAGAPGGPDPAVTRPRAPHAGPVQEATGALHRQAQGGDMTMPYTPMAPDTGTGSGSVDMGTPAANGGGLAASLPAGMTGSGDDTTPITPPSIGQVTSSADPVRRKVMAVTAAISATNPHLPQDECERVARQVVGRYFFEADLNGSVMNDEPVNDGGSGSGGSGGSGGDGGGMLQHGLEWQGLKSMIPGGGGAAAGGGAAEVAELGALAL